MRVIDLSYLREVAGTDEALFDSLVDVLKEELETVWSEFEEFRNETNYTGMHRVVHTLKSKLDIMGLPDDSKRTREMELKLSEEILEDDDEYYLRDLLTELNTLMKNM